MRISVETSVPYDAVVWENPTEADAADELSAVLRGKKVLAVSDSGVPRAALDFVTSALNRKGFEVFHYIFPAGEGSKTLATVSDIYAHLLKFGFNREDAVVAVGGGVVGDVAGFAAATWMRGIRYVQFPTTLLAAVDSSVGGKTGVDFGGGKNLVGAFCQPCLVLADTRLFSTLPERELLSGLGEIVKYGVLAGGNLWQTVRGLRVENGKVLSGGQPADMADLVARCVSIKAEVVKRDEKEGNIRKFLNFGHTFGHAAESLSHFTLAHGVCVMKGMIAVQKLSGGALVPELEAIAANLGVDPAIGFDMKELAAAVRADKKASGDGVTLVVAESAGRLRLEHLPFARLEQMTGTL